VIGYVPFMIGLASELGRRLQLYEKYGLCFFL
jgi:hypothetical protein